MNTHETAQQLSDRINLYKENKERPLNATEYDLQPDNDWGATYFYAEVLLKSAFKTNVVIGRRRLDAVAAAYNDEREETIDIPALLEKDWLRVVMDEVSLPHTIRSAVGRFEKIKKFRHEFAFFDSLTPEQIKEITTDEHLLQAAGGPASVTGLSLPQTKNLFWQETKGKVELPRLDIDRFLLENDKDLAFLAWLKDHWDDNELRISAAELTSIHARHAAFFEATPDLARLIASGKFKVGDTDGYFSLQMRSDGGWSGQALRDKYGALLWHKLIHSADFHNDADRLRFWYLRAVYHQGWVNAAHFFPPDDLKRFMDAAQSLVLNEPDLVNGDREIFKLRTDSHFGRDISFLLPGDQRAVNDFRLTDDLFETYRNFAGIFHGNVDDILFRPESRHAITYFTSQLITAADNNVYTVLESLFSQATQRPFLFLYACQVVRWHRPELLPFIALKPRTASLAFLLLAKVRLSSYAADTAKTIWLSLIGNISALIVGNLAQLHDLDAEAKAKIIFQCLERSTWKKFKIGPDKVLHERIDSFLRTHITGTLLPGQHYDGARKITPLFYAVIMNELIALLGDYRPADTYQNGMLSLPVVELDICLWLLELVALATDDETVRPAQNAALVNYFKNRYLEAMNTLEVQKRDWHGGIKPAIPSWYEHRVNLSNIGWDIACLHLEKAFELNAFLQPVGLVFSAEPGVYDEANRYVAQKLRTHLFVLIEAFNGLFKKKRHYERSGYAVSEVMNKLEIAISDYVIRYSASDPGTKRFDIFQESLERWFGRFENKELLPMIGTVINRFSGTRRQKIVVALTQSDQFVRSLKMLDRIVSEKERLRLLKIVTERDDFKEILGKLSFQDNQFVVSILTQHNDLLQVAEDALAHTEKAAAHHTYTRNENLVFLFRMRLLLAYQKRDRVAIDEMASPGIGSYNGQHFYEEDEKDFYRALLFLKSDDGKQAYALYEQLISRAGEERPVLALNRFAAKLQWAQATEDLKVRTTLAYEALTQWDEFDKNHADKKNWPDIQENVWYNRLHAAELLEDHNSFEKAYAEVDAETRMRPDFLHIRLTELLKSKMQHAAEELLTEAKEFHLLADGNYPDFVGELEKMTDNPETIAFLTSQYDRIFRLAPDKLIQIVPPAVNGGADLPTFLLNELMQSAKDMLDLINVLPVMDYEDKYTDLIMLSLNGRLINYKWHVATLRGGFADPVDNPGQKKSKSNPGEIDLGILTSSNQRLAIGEAMILEGKNTYETQKHNLKIFNYDAARRLFFLLIYYKGPVANFESSWESYVEVLEDFIEFPAGYPLNGKVATLPVTGDHAGLKLGMSLHGSATRLYHLFINVNYHLPTVRKAVHTGK